MICNSEQPVACQRRTSSDIRLELSILSNTTKDIETELSILSTSAKAQADTDFSIMIGLLCVGLVIVVLLLGNTIFLVIYLKRSTKAEKVNYLTFSIDFDLHLALNLIPDKTTSKR